MNLRASRAPSLLAFALLLPAWPLRPAPAMSGVESMAGVATGAPVSDEKAGAGNGNGKGMPGKRQRKEEMVGGRWNRMPGWGSL